LQQVITRAHWHSRVWRMAFPIMLSNLTLPIVGAVDTAMAGHLPGPEYLGGVAVAVLIFSFAFMNFNFMRLSTTGYIAQALGRGDRGELKAVILRAGILAFAIALPLMALQGPILWIALELISASPEVSAQAAAYFNVRIWAAPAVMGNFIVLGVLIGMQKAGWALGVQVVIAGTNVVLDLLFVLEFGWEVPGLAGATVLAEYAGLIVGVVVLMIVVPGARTTWPLAAATRLTAYLPLLALNRDLLIRTLVLSLAFAVFVSLSARTGDVTLAANEVLMMFLTFASFALDGFANACEAIVGEAYGKRDRRSMQNAVAVSTVWAGLTASVFCLVFAVFGDGIINLMTDVEEVRATARTYLPYAVLMPLAGVWSFQLDGIFIGTTRGRDLRNAMLISTVIYLPTSYLLWLAMGNHGLWIALFVLFILRALTLWARYPRLIREAQTEATSV
jgi:multidrug resistance protein, MATE family